MHLNREDMLRVKDAEMLRRALLEAEVSAKKCVLYSGLAHDSRVQKLFTTHGNLVRSSNEAMRQELNRLLLEGARQ